MDCLSYSSLGNYTSLFQNNECFPLMDVYTMLETDFGKHGLLLWFTQLMA